MASVSREASTISMSLLGTIFSLFAVDVPVEVDVPVDVSVDVPVDESLAGLRCAINRFANTSFLPLALRLYWEHLSTRVA